MASDSSLYDQIATGLGDIDQIQKEMAAQRAPQAPNASGFVAPRTPTEKKLAAIWAEFLGLAQVGVNDDFFALGGHSIMATQILARGSAEFQAEIPIEVIFSGDFTIAALAQVIEDYQIQHADPDEIAALMQELDGLSDEEVRALLAEAGLEA